MTSPSTPLRALACAFVFVSFAGAQSPLPPEPVPLDSLAAFRPVTANWKIAGGLAGDPRRDRILTATAGTGVLVCQATADARGQLFTTWEHGDLELDLDFLMTPGADSGLYFQGRYELQIRDSWGKAQPTASDNGGVLPAYDESKPAADRNTGGSAPKANASRAPGLWQRLHVEFEAPRFDAAGKKTKNARFVRVVLNGFTIQENVEVVGVTRGAAFQDEVPVAPLMIQGNNLSPGHAIRNLAVKRWSTEKLTAEDLRYKLYSGDYKDKPAGSYDNEKPSAEGVPERFAHSAVEKSGKFALVFSGALVVPRAGAYRFSLESGGMARLLVDGRPVVVPLERGTQPGIINLTAGKHDFRLDLVHLSNMRPTLELLAEGPGIASHTVTVRDTGGGRGGFGARGGGGGIGGRGGRTLAVEPKDRTILQRGFVPFDPRKRLYAASVGTPAGVHFAYDFETGALLRAWRGTFLNAVDMWENRGEPQLARPNGPALTFNAKPAYAMIEFAAAGDWPVEPEALWSSQGYTLEADGTPVFQSTLDAISVSDRLAPSADGRALMRTVNLKGKLPSWSAWMLLAEAETITAQPDGKGWVVGEREWYLDWPADAAASAVVRTVNGRQQLAVPLTTATLDKPIRYSIVW